MQLKPEEISKIIRAQIKHYENAIEQSETGTVIMVGDGIARASGLEKCMESMALIPVCSGSLTGWRSMMPGARLSIARYSVVSMGPAPSIG